MQTVAQKNVIVCLLLAPAALFSAHAAGGHRPWPRAASSNNPHIPVVAAPTDTSPLPRPALGSVPYGVDIRSCTEPGKVALTFDDGPWKYTSALLDLLSGFQDARATFFVVGNNTGHGRIDDPATGYPDVLRRMHAAGHQIGSHTWTHPDLETLTTAGRRAEVLQNEAAFASALGFFPTYLRPPYTSCRAQCLSDVGALGYHIVSARSVGYGGSWSSSPLAPALLVPMFPRSPKYPPPLATEL